MSPHRLHHLEKKQQQEKSKELLKELKATRIKVCTATIKGALKRVLLKGKKGDHQLFQLKQTFGHHNQWYV